MEWVGLTLEFLILVAVVWEGVISYKHYKHSLGKYQRYKAKRIIRKVLKGD